jgi:hypothetical protein
MCGSSKCGTKRYSQCWCYCWIHCRQFSPNHPGPLIILGLYGAHRHILRQQANRNCVKFAKRISETIHLEGSDRQLTADKLAAEFKKCSAEEDGTISEDDLWVFISSGQAGTMGQADFNGPFAAIYLDN